MPIVAVAEPSQVLDVLRRAGLERGGALAVAVTDGLGVGLATESGSFAVDQRVALVALGLIETDLRPRWTWWDRETPAILIGHGLRVSTCWDVATVHRLLFGGWRAEPARVWAVLHDRTVESIPRMGQLDLLGGGDDSGGDSADPARPDGHLRPEWADGGWRGEPARWAGWAATALTAASLQRQQLAASADPQRATMTARSESAAELLCTELAADGLPISVAEAERIVEGFIGPRPTDHHDAARIRRLRDHAVLAHVASADVDLRNPLQVKAMLRREGIEVSSTRAWKLEELRNAHPVVGALLEWRKAERFATTFGYEWLDSQVGPDGRLRGAWSSSDGAAGRMTAQAGLHNLPTELRPAVLAETGHVFVRADLGQIEPRVLAAVSGDPALARATEADDLYLPVARQLDVERSVAKVAVLAAMYGQTSGAAGRALDGLERAYPVAMAYLRAADEAGRSGNDVTTFGGRRVRVGRPDESLDAAQERAAAASWGRFTRNAVVQGAAAELFKVWAVTVRTRLAGTGARIVLCLHDELLVHAPAAAADTAARVVEAGLQEAAARWHPDTRVRFVADLSVIERWSDAK